jgi:hypothetical protein
LADLITRAAALQAVLDESETLGPLPPDMRAALLADPEGTLRLTAAAAIRATKLSIGARIAVLPHVKPASGPQALANTLDLVGGSDCKASVETKQPSGPRTYYKPHEFL